MLWSLLRIILFVAIVAALTLGTGYLLELGDVVLITVAGREFALTPLVAVIVSLLLILGVWIILRIAGLIVATLRFLNGDETAISRYFNRRGERRGYEALSDGMLALAAGEGRLAIRKAQRAETLLNRPEITNLIVAQGAEMAGDRALATRTLKSLVKDENTRFVGIRGLLRQRLEDGDTDTALKLAERGLAIRPNHGEMQDTLLSLQTSNEDWGGARGTLAAKLKSGTLPRDVHRRRDAVLALAHAREALAEGKIDAARREATEANRMSPDLIPAAVMAARMALDEGKPRVAARVLRKAWDATPHPDLAAAFAAIAPDESPAARIKRFAPWIAKHKDHQEARLLEAELKLAAEDFPGARKALGDLPETAPTARSLTIMAAIERGQGAEDRVIRAWLARAVTASRGAQWLCSSCGHVHGDWRPVCENCESFDTLTWEAPAQSEAALSATAQMLPLVVGALEDQSDAADQIVDGDLHASADADAIDEEGSEKPGASDEIIPQSASSSQQDDNDAPGTRDRASPTRP